MKPSGFGILVKRGLVSSLMRQMGSLPPEQRPEAGQVANLVKNEVTEAVRNRLEALSSDRETLPALDVTLPGRRRRRGHKHLITRVMEDVSDIFIRMGFDVAEGPEVELDYYCFEALNFPKDHPARDMQDTPLYLRRCGFKDAYLAHAGQDHGKNHAAGLGHRSGEDLSAGFGYQPYPDVPPDRGSGCGPGYHLRGPQGRADRLRSHLFLSGRPPALPPPGFFPFTEPSAEVDIGCVICGGSGCRTCGFTGWLEILGSGMVDPEVFKYVEYDPAQVTGFAFGMGLERLAMLKYGVEDIRLLYENDLRFLNQF